MNDSEKNRINGDEDKTKYGEQIPTMFSWISLANQKKRAEELDNMTKGKKKEP